MRPSTISTQAVYEHGVFRPKRRVALRDHTIVTLTIIKPSDPVNRTRGLFRVPKRMARVLIYDDSLLET